MIDKTILVVQGASGLSDVPGLAAIADKAEIRFATDKNSLHSSLSGADVLFGWDFRADDLEACWHAADSLKWIHWGGAGVDAALFPDLVGSDVTLTNSRGVFDQAMAEWTLGVMIAHAKRLPETLMFQQQREWNYRQSTQMLGQKVAVVGVGSIGRAVARIVTAFGMDIVGVGRSARDNDPDFGHIHAQNELNTVLADADYVVLITPLTAETRNLFDAGRFAAMKPGAMFINIGRGQLADETALIGALESGQIGCAALDVFCEEPLNENNPLWSAPNIIISPHMSGDFLGHYEVMADLFFNNFARYQAGETLLNVVDKTRGFVPSVSSA
ncbi:MAG: D-2-hydroxyacid dehydrogenase [Rhodospirillales bacterium]|nr:D-2-hydroxyacid dehydrogenase [Rhodospirillales bacterium]